MVTDYQPGALAPLTTDLIWGSVSMWSIPYIFPSLPLFLGQHVVRMEFTIMGDVITQVMTIEWTLTRVPRLKQLGLSNISGSNMNLDQLIPAVPWDNLQILDMGLGAITLASIPVLMSEPQLVDLRMIVEIKQGTTPRPTAPHPGSQEAIHYLQRLRISTNGADAIAMALEYLPKRNQLQSLFCMLLDDEYSPSTIHHLFSLLDSKCNPDTFTELRFVGCKTIRELDDVVNRNDHDQAVEVDISALLSLSRLKVVEIFLPALRVELTPMQAKAIPAAWPQIEYLFLNAFRYAAIWTSRPRIDHTHPALLFRVAPAYAFLASALMLQRSMFMESSNKTRLVILLKMKLRRTAMAGIV